MAVTIFTRIVGLCSFSSLYTCSIWWKQCVSNSIIGLCNYLKLKIINIIFNGTIYIRAWLLIFLMLGSSSGKDMPVASPPKFFLKNWIPCCLFNQIKFVSFNVGLSVRKYIMFQFVPDTSFNFLGLWSQTSTSLNYKGNQMYQNFVVIYFR